MFVNVDVNQLQKEKLKDEENQDDNLLFFKKE